MMDEQKQPASAGQVERPVRPGAEAPAPAQTSYVTDSVGRQYEVLSYTAAQLAAAVAAERERCATDAQRYRKLRDADMDERNRLEHYAGPALDEALDALPAVRAALTLG